ncbi:MAG: ABC transporter ATP-binding protein, partial [Nocardioides sp.]
MLIRLLRRYLRPYLGLLGIVVLMHFVATMAALYLPSLNADLIDKGVAVGDTDYIWRVGGVMLVVTLVQSACTVVAVWFASRAAMGLGRDVRRDLFDRVSEFSTREVQEFGAPSLITRGTNDVQQVQMLAQTGGTMMVAAPIMLVGSIAMAMHEDVGLSKILLFTVPALALSVVIIVIKMVPSFRGVQEQLDEVNRLLREQITGVRVVRAFVREQTEVERFARANRDLTSYAVRAGRWQALMFPTVMLILNISMVAVLWLGGHRVEDGEMQVGQLTAFIAYLVQILMSVMIATFTLIQVPRASVSADRIGEVLDTHTSVVPAAHPQTVPDGPVRVAFESVEFSYPGAQTPVLRDLNLTAEPGQTTAIIGSTGAGKSTLLNVIPRLFDVTAGRVTVSGVDVREVDEESLWDRIGLVPQRAFLFSGTVASNLRYGKADATEEEMWEALRIAQAADFVAEMPGGLEATIAQGGSNVSGGQRQRLAIARAVIRRPEIYLFDDSFSALDLATDARLRAALEPVVREATVIIVAQRVSTIRQADQIIVLEDGEIVGRGSHEQLLAGCQTYQEIVSSQ